MKHIFVVNPAAGKGIESSPLIEKITGACLAAEVDYEIYITKDRNDVTSFVKGKVKEKPKDEIYRFYSCGGDGTLGEVVSGVVNENIHGAIPGVQVTCIPTGTGNDFIRNFMFPEFFSDITKQLLGDPITIDCFAFNDVYGINMFNVGFDCDVALTTQKIKKYKFMPKSLAYTLSVFTTMLGNPGQYLRIIGSDNSTVVKNFLLCSVANGAFCGGGFNSAPDSCLDDGLLDIIVVDKVSKLQLMKLVHHLRKGTHIKTRLGKRVILSLKDTKIKFLFKEPTEVCVDGERYSVKEADFHIVPLSVNFSVPVGSYCNALNGPQYSNIDELLK